MITNGSPYPTIIIGSQAYPGGAYNISDQTFDDQVIGGAFLTGTTGTQNGITVNYFFGIASGSVSIGDSPTAVFRRNRF